MVHACAAVFPTACPKQFPSESSPLLCHGVPNRALIIHAQPSWLPSHPPRNRQPPWIEPLTMPRHASPSRQHVHCLRLPRPHLTRPLITRGLPEPQWVLPRVNTPLCFTQRTHSRSPFHLAPLQPCNTSCIAPRSVPHLRTSMIHVYTSTSSPSVIYYTATGATVRTLCHAIASYSLKLCFGRNVTSQYLTFPSLLGDAQCSVTFPIFEGPVSALAFVMSDLTAPAAGCLVGWALVSGFMPLFAAETTGFVHRWCGLAPTFGLMSRTTLRLLFSRNLVHPSALRRENFLVFSGTFLASTQVNDLR